MGVMAGLAGVLLAGTAMAQTALAPTGTLRAAINFGNPVLAQRGPDGVPQGVSVVLATELARRLGVPLAIVPFEAAGAVTAALGEGRYDLAFMAIDPVRGEGLDFTAPYVLIEGGYAVRDASPVTTVDQVDAPGVVRFWWRRGAPTTCISHARIDPGDACFGSQRATMPPPRSASGEGDVLAGVRQVSVRLVAETPGLRMVPGRFMSIEQAIAVPKGRDASALAAVQAFVVEMKASGVVAQALAETGQHDAEVAP